MDTNKILSAYKTAKNYSQDKQLASDLFISTGRLCDIKKKRSYLTDKQAFFLAQELNIEPEIILTIRNKEKAKDPRIKTSYQAILEQITKGKNIVIPMAIGGFGVYVASIAERVSEYALYTLC